MSDLIHIVNDYKTDVDHQWRDHTLKKIADVKKGKLEAERRAAESEKREVEATKKNFDEKTRMADENQKLRERVAL